MPNVRFMADRDYRRQLGRLRKPFLAAAAALWVVMAPLASPAPAGDPWTVTDIKQLERVFVDFARVHTPSVVALRTYRLIQTGDDRNVQIVRKAAPNQGTGFFVTSAGHLLTNYHVVEGVDQVLAILHDGREFVANPVGTDPRADLAVLKIDLEPTLPVRFSPGVSLKVGQWAVAIGNPFGLASYTGKSSVTYGQISALGRDMNPWLRERGRDTYYGNMVETSVAINPGNSGGPLFDLDGDVIGVVTAIETKSGVSEGLGFAIAMDAYTQRIVNTLVTGKPVQYGYLGLRPMDPAPGTRGEQFLRGLGVAPGTKGVIVEYVDAGLPADQAGLKRGDVLIEYNGVHLENADQLYRLVGATPVGATAVLRYLREGRPRTAEAVIGDRGRLVAAAMTGDE